MSFVFAQHLMILTNYDLIMICVIVKINLNIYIRKNVGDKNYWKKIRRFPRVFRVSYVFFFWKTLSRSRYRAPRSANIS